MRVFATSFLFYISATHDRIDRSPDKYSDDGGDADWDWGDDDTDQLEMGTLNSTSEWNGSRQTNSNWDGSPVSSRSASSSPPSLSLSPVRTGSPSRTSPTTTVSKKGMQLNQPILKSIPAQQHQYTLSPPPLLKKPAGPVVPAPSSDIFAELGLAAHPQFPHHHQVSSLAPTPQKAPISVAPSSLPSTWSSTGTTTTPAATAPLPTKSSSIAQQQEQQQEQQQPQSRTLPRRVVSDGWDENGDDDGFGDEWGDGDDLDDLLLDD